MVWHLVSYSHQLWLVVFYWGLSESKFSQVSRTLLSILADLNNTVVWIVSIRPPISNSSSTLSQPLGTVPSALITLGITITLMFHGFLNTLVMSKHLSLSASLILTLWSARMAKSTIQQVLFLFFSFFFFFFFLLIITRSSLLTGNRFCLSKIPEKCFASHSLAGILFCAYTIWLCGPNLDFLHNSRWSPSPPSYALTSTVFTLVGYISLRD